VPRTALEAGNSAATIFSHYRALATEAEGKAWFAIEPEHGPERDPDEKGGQRLDPPHPKDQPQRSTGNARRIDIA